MRRVPADANDERPWDVRVLELIDPGVDGTLVAESLRRTPTERLRILQDRIRFLERTRRDRP